MYSDDEVEYCDDDDELEETDFEQNQEERTSGLTFVELRNAIASWFIDTKTPQRKSKELLHILRDADPSSIFSSLPNDPRTLYPKISMEQVKFTKMELGEYAYLGNILIPHYYIIY